MTPEEAAAAADFGKPSARKTGRNPLWPYVPVLVHTDDVGRERHEQVTGFAYVTREEAVASANRHINTLRRQLAEKLAKPNYRALRSHHGVS